MITKKPVVCMLFLMTMVFSGLGDVLVPTNSVWKYRDDGSDQGTAWQAAGFDDSSWASGPAELGGGDGDEATLINIGPDGARFPTVYFRRAFNVTNAAGLTGLTIRLLRDDGAVVYLNGTEVFRSNMPGGTITRDTLATTSISGTEETTFFEATANPTVLVGGANLIAVEVHQGAVTSSDLSFNLELSGSRSQVNTPPSVNITNPLAGATYTAPATVLIEASASDTEGPVSQVEFLQGGSSLGTDTTAPFSYAWSNVMAGSYALTAVATDAGGLTATSAVVNITVVSNTVVRTNTLVAQGSVWKYLDDGSDQGTAWRDPAFNDTLWAEGPAQLGYGDGDEATLVNGGPTSTRFITTYFRRAFNLTGGSAYNQLNLRLLRDDGAVVYLNGVEAYRDGMPEGTITALTLASLTVGGTDELLFVGASLNPGLLVEGNNVVAVEIHQVNTASSDISFDLELTGVTGSSGSNAPPTVALTSPTDNAGFIAPATIPIAASAADDGAVTRVEFYANGIRLGQDLSSPYTFNWTDVSGGTYQLRAVATDNFGLQSTSAVVRVNVTGNTAPTVAITKPANGATFEVPTNILIEATATDSDGSITRVEFFLGGAKLGEDTTTPYSFVWSNALIGSFVLTATATDNGNAKTTSDPIQITVTGLGPATLIPVGALWKYLDNGSNQGTNWVTPSFDDSSWASGPAQLGYGDGDETTVVSYGPDPNNKFVTTYFRHALTVSDPTQFSYLTLRLLRDDGGVVYLNGTEVFRSNMPEGPIDYLTHGPNAADDGRTFQSMSVNRNLLVAGRNVVAVEMHQANATSTDVTFDLELIGNTGPISNALPFVSITTPGNNSTFSEPAAITINALASDSDGMISRVEFYEGTTKLGADASSPFSLTWSGVPVGNYRLIAVATDNLGGQATSAVVNVQVAVPSPPTVASVTPGPGPVTGLIQITVTFSEAVLGVNAGDLLVNGMPATGLSGADAVYTFTFAEPPEGLVTISWAGQHGIVDYENPPQPFNAVAPGSIWQYTLTDTVPPRLSQLSPSPGATVTTLRQIRFTFSEPVQGLDAVDLLINGAAASRVSGFGAGPYQFEFPEPISGLVQVAWASGHGIRDLAAVGNAFVGGSWSYTLNTNASFAGKVVINEIMYHPSSENIGEEYIELLNLGSASVNLTGWEFSRGISYRFTNVTVAAGSYMVVAADVAAFQSKYPGVVNVVGGWAGQLSNSREEIELEDALGNRVDLVNVADEGDWAIRQRGPLDYNHRGWEWFTEADGLGRSKELRNAALENDSGQNWADSLVLQGTPGVPNSTATNNLPPMILQVEHLPAVPRSTEPVSITARILDEQTTGLTVRLFYRDASTVSPPAFASLTMADDAAHNDSAAGDGVYGVALPAMTNRSIIEFYVEATDASGNRRTWPAAAKQGDGSFAQTANALFQVDDEIYPGNQPIYRLIMTETERAEFDQINESGDRQSNAEMNGTFLTIDGTGTKLRYNIGMRIRGAGSRGSIPPNMRVNIPTDRIWNGVNEINLNCQYTHAQLIGSALALRSGLQVPNARAVQVRINGRNRASSGQPQFNSYVLVEVVNGDWTANHFPQDPDGNVYSARRPWTDLSYLGTDPQSYINTGYSKHSNASENDWTDLINLTFVLNNAPDSTYAQQVRQVANVEEWMGYFALHTVMAYDETALGTGQGDDYDMYRGVVDPRFLLIPHDFDTILGQGDHSYPTTLDIFRATALPSINRFLTHPEFLPIYYAELRRMLTTTFSTNQINPLLDQVLGDFVPGNVVNDMKQFVAARNQYVLAQLPPVPAAPARATIMGEPSPQTYLTTATLTVGGPDITHYRFRLNNGAYGPITPVATPIVLNGLANGSYTVFVIGQNSSGVFQAEANATPSRTWTVNTALAGAVINEVLARNVSALNHFGTFPDLIELYNASSVTKNLSGLRLTDDPTDPNKFTFPLNTTLAPGAYLVLIADSDSTPGIHLGFALNQDGESVYLFDSTANGGRVLDWIRFGPQLADHSIGRLPNGQWGLTTPTFGGANVARPVGSTATLKINEWLASGLSPFPVDFIELFNPDPLPVNLGGLFLSDEPLGYPDRHPIAPLSFVAGGGYVVFLADDREQDGPLHLNFELSPDQGRIGLFTPDLVQIDWVWYGPQRTDISQGRSPNGASTFAFFTSPTPGSVNPSPGPPPFSGLVINEVLANNDSLDEPDGSRPDWIELYNGAGATITLSDMSLSDQIGNPRRWVFPPGVTIASGQYRVIRFDSSAPVSATNTGYGLKTSGDSIYLFDTLANGGILIDSVSFGIQAPDWPIGRAPTNGGTNWTLTLPTKGTSNLAASLGDPAQLKLNEWMAAPTSGDDWFEVYNPNPQPVGAGGLHLSDDLNDRTKYRIPPLSFIATGLRGFQKFVADDNVAAGADHTNFKLSAGGESLGISTAQGVLINSVTFGPQQTGVSEGRLTDGETNIVRFPKTASPGESNYLPIPNVVINEVLTHTDPPFEDAIELRNTSGSAVNISGWFLSDSQDLLRKFRIPDGTLLLSNGYCVFYETQFNAIPGDATSFSLNSARGDQVFLSQATAGGQLTGYRAVERFGAAENGVSFGRHPTSVGFDFVAMSRRTFGVDNPDTVQQFRTGTGLPNPSPKVGPVVISEIMYHPPDVAGQDNVADEYIELHNLTGSPVTLQHPTFTTNVWRLRNAVSFDFPPNTTIPAGDFLVAVSFDPVANPAALAAFRARYNLSPGAAIVGPYTGKLDNSSDSVELYKPDAPQLPPDPDAGYVPQVLVDRVQYQDVPPWPAGTADGLGDSLHRINLDEYGNDPINWTVRAPSPGPQQQLADNDGDGMPNDWELANGLDPADPSDAAGDRDGDGMSNLEEYRSGTDPNNPASYLRIDAIQVVGGQAWIEFIAVAGKTYTVQFRDSLTGGAWQTLGNVPAQPVTQSITLPHNVGTPQRYYRLVTPAQP